MATQKPSTGLTRRQWVTLATVGGAGAMLPISWPQAAQNIPVTIRYNRVRHVKNLIPSLVQNPEFFHQPHGEDLAAQLYRGLYNWQEPRQATIRQITKNLNTYGPERVVWSMVTSKKFHDIRRPLDWHARFHVETPTRASRDAAYLNRRLEALYEGLYGRRPTSFELTDSLRDLLVPVRTEQLGVVVSRMPQGLRLTTAVAQDAGDGGYSVSSTNHTISFDANQVLTEAIISQISAAATLAGVAAILVPLGISLIATVPATAVTVIVIGTVIFLTSFIPFSIAIYTYNNYYTTLGSSPSGSSGSSGGADDPYGSDPSPYGGGPPPGASMDVSVSIGDGPAPGDSSVGSDPGDPGDGGADGGSGAGTGDGGDGGGGGDGGW
jgi:hypothetical protein